MAKFDVIVYGTFWHRIEGIEAKDHAEAIAAAEERNPFYELSSPKLEYAEEMTGFIVENNDGSQSYDGNGNPTASA